MHQLLTAAQTFKPETKPMSKILQNLTLAASLALAALPALALTTSAHASPYGIKVSDLDLSEASAQSVLQQRVDRAAENLCKHRGPQVGTRIDDSKACKAAVRAEAMEKLAALSATSSESR